MEPSGFAFSTGSGPLRPALIPCVSAYERMPLEPAKAAILGFEEGMTEAIVLRMAGIHRSSTLSEEGMTEAIVLGMAGIHRSSTLALSVVPMLIS